MKMNTLAPAAGSKPPKKRLGRGIGSGLGKTSGKGHKGQTARAGGKVRRGFEGGQSPIQRRVGKFGFRSQKALATEEVRLGEVAGIAAEAIDLDALKSAGLVRKSVKHARIMLSGAIDRAVTVKGVHVSKGAKAAIEAAGGRVEE